jgi:PAS domain S-box-containing protein
MRPAIGKQLINGIVIAIVSVIVIVVLSIWQYQRIQDTGVVIKHTNQVLYQTEQVLNATVQYELNVKNYLLTGDSVFLQTAGDMVSLLPVKIDELKVLTVDNPVQQLRIDSLSRYADKDRATLQQAMRLSQSGNSEGAAALVRAEATSGYSYQVQSVIARVEAEERGLLEQRRRSGQVKALQLQVVLWSLIAAVAVLAIVVFRKVRIDLGREQLAREQLSHFNQELEKEVQGQTASLQASEDKYKTLFYKSPLPKWIYDEQTLQFFEVNEAAVRSYGYSHEEFRNMTIMDIRPPEDRERLMLDVEDVRRNPLAAEGLPQGGPGSYRESQWRHVKKNGEVIDVDVIAHPIEFGGRKARMVVVNDITDRKRYEGKLQRLNSDLARRAAELAASNAELERFAYIASHDLQEPLRMVSSFLQLLQKKYGGQLDAKADQYIHYAVDGAERMKALIMDLLEYSRVGTGKEGFGWVETATVLAEVGETFREKIVAARARIEIGVMPRVWGDKVQLTQLLQNLVSNALKYHSDEPPVIRIGAVEEVDVPGERPGHWRFSVSDNGIGIDPLFFDKIFIIFQRLHNKTDYSGTGIGLAICKKIVERHGGKIWVESDRHQGSTFFFTINKKI